MKLSPRVDFFLETVRSRIRERLLGRRAVGVLLETKNGVFACPTYDTLFSTHFETHDSWDEATLEELYGLIDSTSRVLVVGAHLGLLALPLARRAAECVAVEANPATFRLLEMNIAINGLHNIRAIQTAAGEKSGQIDFVMSRANTGGSKRAPLHKDWIYYADAPKTMTAKMVALDDALPGETFDLIVMDIEGSEYFALQGMPRLLAACRHLQMEYVCHHIDRVAGVDDAAMMALLSPHFSRAHVAGEATESVPRERFAELFAKLRLRGQDGYGADIVFSK